jgi:hypothetical protein
VSGYRKLVDPIALYRTVLPVSLDTAFAVQATGVTFALLVCGSDLGSSHLEALIRTALQHYQPRVLTIKVQITCADDANRLAATMVPQLRLYRGGQETARQRGTMEYSRLVTFLQEAARE